MPTCDRYIVAKGRPAGSSLLLGVM